jgi:hypothetical protein
MCDLKTILNSVGLLLTIIGVYVVYRNSPINTSVIDGGGPFTDFNAIKSQKRRANHFMRIGVYVVLAGTVFQLVSNFIPSRP